LISAWRFCLAEFSLTDLWTESRGIFYDVIVKQFNILELIVYSKLSYTL
jgi:hypothetical protein